MADFNVNWDRWIAASINQHFKTLANTASVSMFVEGEERRTSDLQEYIEVRHDGLGWEEFTKDEWKGLVQINVLCVTHNGDDLYAPSRLLGKVGEMFAECIPVYQYQDGDAQFGELTRITKLDVHKFGQIEPDVKLIQTSIESTYRIWL